MLQNYLISFVSSCQARGSLIFENQVNWWLWNNRKTPVFWSCAAWGSAVALPHINLQWYLNMSYCYTGQDKAFMKISFEEDNFFHVIYCRLFINLCWPWLSMTLSFRHLARLQTLQNYQIHHHHHHYHKHTHIHWTTSSFGGYQHIWLNGKRMKVQSWWKISTNQCSCTPPLVRHDQMEVI